MWVDIYPNKDNHEGGILLCFRRFVCSSSERIEGMVPIFFMANLSVYLLLILFPK